MTQNSNDITEKTAAKVIGLISHGVLTGLQFTVLILCFSINLLDMGAIIGPYLAGLLMTFGWSREEYFTVMGAPLLLAALAIGLIGVPRLGTSAQHEASV